MPDNDTRNLRPALLALTGALGILCAQPAAATANPARVDMSQPHLQPPYPDGAQQDGEQGAVVMDVYVRSDGRPSKARVDRSSGFPDLDTAAVQGVLNWRFIPASENGETVSDWTKIQIVFQLPAPPPPPAGSTASH
ncbi:MAG TPA: energy transducer TonB [Rhizomicrobium sp.]|jgi:protein TonB